MKIARIAVSVVAAFTTVALTLPAPASAMPGQCWNSPFGGFCDTAPLSDGSFQHCVSFGGSSFCTQACHDPISNQAVPTDLDERTPC